jgi:carboxypeptidase family protein
VDSEKLTTTGSHSLEQLPQDLKNTRRQQMGSIRTAWNAVVLLAVLALAIVTSQNAAGQGITTGSIAGTIADQQGAVVPQAAITAVETATNATFKTTSGSDGLFFLRNLPIGNYTVTVMSGGFSPLDIKNINVTAGIETQVGIAKLAIGSTTSVLVETTAPVLETSQAQVSTSFDSKQLQRSRYLSQWTARTFQQL